MHLLGLKRKMIILEKQQCGRVGNIFTLRQERENRTQHSQGEENEKREAEIENRWI